jgi:hypothetical protein
VEEINKRRLEEHNRRQLALARAEQEMTKGGVTLTDEEAIRKLDEQNKKRLLRARAEQEMTKDNGTLTNVKNKSHREILGLLEERNRRLVEEDNRRRLALEEKMATDNGTPGQEKAALADRKFRFAA